MKTMNFRIEEEYIEKLNYICQVRNMSRVDVIRKFIDTQYEMYNKDSDLNKLLTQMETLTKSIDDYTKKLNSES